MNNLVNIVLCLFLVISIGSCTPSAPYEIRSPCVSDDSNDTPFNPCPRRSVNGDHFIV